MAAREPNKCPHCEGKLKGWRKPRPRRAVTKPVHPGPEVQAYFDETLDKVCRQYDANLQLVLQKGHKAPRAAFVRSVMVAGLRDTVWCEKQRFPRKYTICRIGTPVPTEHNPISYPTIITLLTCWTSHTTAVLSEANYRHWALKNSMPVNAPVNS